MSSSCVAVARAAQIAAAAAAGDHAREQQIIEQTMQADGPVGLAGMVLALAERVAGIAKDFYDTDYQRILDMFAMAAMSQDLSD